MTSNGQENMNHERLKDQLLMLYDGELSGTQARETVDHLAACPECRKTYAQWNRVAGVFFKTPQVRPSPLFVRNLMSRIESLEIPARKIRPPLLRWIVPPMGMGLAAVLLTWNFQLVQTPQVSIEDLLLTNGREVQSSEWIFGEDTPKAQEVLALALEEP